jgi:hypothetical protein
VSASDAIGNLIAVFCARLIFGVFGYRACGFRIAARESLEVQTGQMSALSAPSKQCYTSFRYQQ